MEIVIYGSTRGSYYVAKGIVRGESYVTKGVLRGDDYVIKAFRGDSCVTKTVQSNYRNVIFLIIT